MNRHPLGTHTPLGKHPLPSDTIGHGQQAAVRILLECILVQDTFDMGQSHPNNLMLLMSPDSSLIEVVLGLLSFEIPEIVVSHWRNIIKVFVNNTTWTILTYLTYLSTMYFNLEEIISCVWDTLVF